LEQQASANIWNGEIEPSGRIKGGIERRKRIQSRKIGKRGVIKGPGLKKEIASWKVSSPEKLGKKE
jgi:hypothetical protein